MEEETITPEVPEQAESVVVPEESTEIPVDAPA